MEDTPSELPTQAVGEAAPAAGAPSRSERPLPPGTTFGRYTLLEELGRGGMGVVYRAYDRELHRSVALKILRVALEAGAADRSGTAARLAERLIREAQALARLSHPNVVAVHDLGMFDDAVFVAMELVQGSTLRRWLRERKRTWREIVLAFEAAGEGLAAAHAAGIVHRDFKPDNVVVGVDGRVRVLDFGLARVTDSVPSLGTASAGVTPSAPSPKPKVTPVGQPRPEPHASVEAPPFASDPASGPGRGSSSPEEPLTRHGAILGTQLYMAPEQLRGLPADARSDQYAFAVSLYEGLVGRRPFASARDHRLNERDREGLFRGMAPGRSVPRHVRRVLTRALSTHADDRYPSMAALLHDLRRDPVRSMARWAPVVLGGLALVLAVVIGRRTVDARLAVCRGGEPKLAAVWSQERRDAIRSAFQVTKLESAKASAERVVADLDAYAERWLQNRQDACEATRVRREQSEAVLDLRVACLERRLLALKAQVDVLARADATVVGKSILAVKDLPTLDACADIDGLKRAVPLPTRPGIRENAETTTLALSEARALVLTGKYEQAARLATSALERARAMPFRPLEAEALFLLGRAEDLLARYDDAERHLKEAARAAIAGRRDDTLAEAWTDLVRVQGIGLLRFADAHETALVAEAAVEPLEDAAPLRSNLLRQEGELAYREGNLDMAKQKAEEAVALAERVYTATDLRLGAVLLQLGMALSMSNRLDDAEAVFRRSIAIAHAAGIEEHTNIAAAINNLGYIASMRGQDDEALARYLEARDMWIHTLGPEHPQVADARLNIGSTLVAFGRIDEALAELEEARRVYVALRGPASVDEAIMLGELATAHAKRHEVALALDLFAKAVAIYEAHPQDPDRFYVYAGRGEVLLAQKRYDEAGRDFEAALTMARATQGAEHPRVLDLRLAVARARFGQGRFAEVLATAVDVGDVARRTRALPALRFQALALEAFAAAHLPREHAHAIRAGKDLSELAPSLPNGSEVKARIEAWLGRGAPAEALDESLTGGPPKP